MMRIFYTSLLLVLLSQSSFATEITATPGTYELLEGTTMQFDARSNERSGQVANYRWTIVAGEGASLVNADQARVTFVAPAIDEKKRLFTLQLTLEYKQGKPSTADINIRVHKKSKEKTEKRNTSPWVSGTIGFGFGYLWGGWWPYPPLIVIPCPPPDTSWPPEEIPPVAIPLPEDPGYADWIADNPDLVEKYLDDTELTAEPLPVDEVEPATSEQPIMDQEHAPEASIEPAPSIEPMPSIEPAPSIEPMPSIEPVPAPMPEPMPSIEPVPAPMPEPMPAIEAEPMPMDMPMDIPIDIPLD